MSFRGLLSYLSRLPGPSEDPTELARSVALIPVAGLVTGALAGLTGLLLFSFLPGLVAAFLFVVGYFLIKGILHVDGLADVADGLAAHGSPEDRQRAMHDPHVGAAGAFALALVPLGIFAAVASLPPMGPPLPYLPAALPSWAGSPLLRWNVLFAVLLAEVVANSCMVLTMYRARASESSRYAAPFVRATSGGAVAVALLLSVGVALLLGVWMIASVAVALAVALFVRSLAHRSLGGVGGDVLGAVQQTAFVAVLLLSAALPWAPWR